MQAPAMLCLGSFLVQILSWHAAFLCPKSLGNSCSSLAIGKCCTFPWFLKGMVGSSKVGKKGTDHTGGRVSMN